MPLISLPRGISICVGWIACPCPFCQLLHEVRHIHTVTCMPVHYCSQVYLRNLNAGMPHETGKFVDIPTCIEIVHCIYVPERMRTATNALDTAHSPKLVKSRNGHRRIIAVEKYMLFFFRCVPIPGEVIPLCSIVKQSFGRMRILDAELLLWHNRS